MGFLKSMDVDSSSEGTWFNRFEEVLQSGFTYVHVREDVSEVENPRLHFNDIEYFKLQNCENVGWCN